MQNLEKFLLICFQVFHLIIYICTCFKILPFLNTSNPFQQSVESLNHENPSWDGWQFFEFATFLSFKFKYKAKRTSFEDHLELNL